MKKCGYKHCKHESNELDETKDPFVKIGVAKYYHEDCYHEQETIKEIIDVFAEKANPNVVFSTLRSVINNIVYERNISADFLLYALNVAIEKKAINYPMGLYYLIQNKKTIRDFDKLQSKIKIEKEMAEREAQGIQYEEKETEFSYKPTKQKDLGDMFC